MSMAHPVLLYDGTCGFCSASSCRLERRLAGKVDRIPFQTWEEMGHSTEGLRGSVVLLEPEGRVSRGIEAVFRLWAMGGHTVCLSLYERSRLFAGVCRMGYRAVASNRTCISRLFKLSPDLP